MSPSSPGLVIVGARYGPKEYDDDAVKGLDIDVTIPLQALVNNSQLYIPGGRSKVCSGPPLFVSLHFLCFSRDCLAAPGTTVADTGAAVGNPNKNKTCYKCQQEGHVCVSAAHLATLY